MKIVCILNSAASYERIKNQINIDEIQWTMEDSIDRLRLILATNYYDMAIVDHSITPYDDIIDLLELKEVMILHFRGKYDEIVKDANRKILEFIKEEKSEEELYQKDLKETKNESSNITINKIIKTERIEVPVIQNMANTLISVVNLSERAGSTFIATSLARGFAQRDIPVTLIENPVGTVDAYYSMGFSFEPESYYSYRKNLKQNGRIDKKKLPVVRGVSVASIEPDYDLTGWTENDTLRLFSSYSGINIVDIGWNYKDEKIKDILNISHTVLVVIDPNPTQIVRNDERFTDFELMEKNGVNVKYVFNKWDDSIDRKKFIEGFIVKPFITVNSLFAEDIYETYYKPHYEFLIDSEVIGEELRDSFFPLLKLHVPSENFGTVPKKKKMFSFGRS